MSTFVRTPGSTASRNTSSVTFAFQPFPTGVVRSVRSRRPIGIRPGTVFNCEGDFAKTSTIKDTEWGSPTASPSRSGLSEPTLNPNRKGPKMTLAVGRRVTELIFELKVTLGTRLTSAFGKREGGSGGGVN